jgi:opacity protein-like surface antigen
MRFKTLRTITAATAISAVGVYGAARADDVGGVYFGGNFGRAHNTYDTGFIDSEIASAASGEGDSASYRARSIRRMSDVWWGDAGYLFNPYIGVEAAFFHLGQMKYWAVGTFTDPNGAQSLSTKTEVTSHGPALSLVLRLPFSETFEADLRAGDYYGKTTTNTLITIASESAPNSASKSSSSLLVGVGAAYTIAAHWSLRADVLRVNKAGDSSTVGRFSVNLVTLGASYTF